MSNLCLSRRVFLGGAAAAVAAPMIARYASLMPVRGIIYPVAAEWPIHPDGVFGVGMAVYRLDENMRPVRCKTWAESLIAILDPTRKIAHDDISGASVSTVFIAIDDSHNFLLPGTKPDPNWKPRVFETMIFNHRGDDTYCERYTSYEDALAGHKRAVAIISAPNVVRLKP